MNHTTWPTKPLQIEDEPFLWEMIYQAIHVPPGKPAPPRSLIDQPDISRYVNGWGRTGDSGFTAVSPTTNKPVGAVWLRIWSGSDQGYGFIYPSIPELSIATLPTHRGQGVGTALLTALLAPSQPHAKISLSVSADNPAYRLYQRFGFTAVSRTADTITMCWNKIGKHPRI